MKRVLFGLVAAAALMFIPTAAEAGHYHGAYGWGAGYGGGYGRGWDRHDCHRPPRVVYRRPVAVYPTYPAYGYPYGGRNTSFYYNGPNASFGFGF
jgi:hypothetical protein